MKKILFAIFFITIFLTGYTQVQADHPGAVNRMSSRFFHDNGSTNWEVAWRYLFTNTSGRTNFRDGTLVWRAYTNVVANCYEYAPFNKNFDWCNAQTPNYDMRNNERPTYIMQWATTCIDPKEPSHFNLYFPNGPPDPAPPMHVYLFKADVTYGPNAANNQGRVPYAYFNNGRPVITGRTDRCPFNQPPPPPTGRSATTSCVNLSTSRINFEWNPIANDSYYDFRLRRRGNNWPNNPDRVEVARGGDGKIHHIVNVADNTVFDWQVNGHTTNPWPGPTGWSGIETIRSANNNACETRDLIITNFRFPGGIDTGTSDAIVEIRNIGNSTITNPFDVSVDSIQGGGGTTDTWRVNQALSPGERLDLSRPVNRFANIPRPNAGNYTAVATVDSRTPDEVNEELENNNRETFDYTTTMPPTYSISGGIFVDNDLDGIREATDGNGRKNAGEDYIDGKIRIAGVNYNSTAASGFDVGDTGGRFFFEGIYNVAYTSLPASGYTISFPRNGSAPPSVNVTVGNPCVDGGGDSRCVGGNIRDLNFGIAPIIADPWIQAVGGDFRMDIGGYKNVIPNALGSGNTCVGNLTRAFVSSNSVPGSKLSEGIVFTGKGANPIFTESGSNADSKATPNGWLVAGNDFTPARPKTIKTSYAYIKAAMDKARIATNPMIGSSANRACNQAGGPNCTFRPAGELSGIPSGAFTHTGTVTLPSQGAGGTYTFPGGNDFVFLINGNLNINTNIDVPTNSTVMFIVSGNITIDPSVSQIEGIFSADGSFTITAGGSNNPLVVEGSVIANAGYDTSGTMKITNGRDLDTFNNTCPAFRVVSRPDFILNGPELLRFPVSIISEVAPQGGN